MKKMSHKLYSRVVSAALAFVIAVSGLSTVVPILFNGVANAATYTVNAGGSIQTAIDNATNGDTINVAAGTYTENIVINKDVTIAGAGQGSTSIVATNANATPVTFATNGATLSGFTITHNYSPSELSAWNFNNNDVTFNQGTSGNTLSNDTVSLGRNGVYLNNASATITNSTITNNRTGFNLTNKIDGTTITNNTISNNWTLGLVYYEQGFGTNFNTVTLTGNTFANNWYTQLEVKTAPLSTGTFKVASNTYTNTPITLSTSSDPSLNEPGFAAQQPVALGGTAVKPATAYPTLRIYGSNGVTLQYDTTAPVAAIKGKGNAYTPLSTGSFTYNVYQTANFKLSDNIGLTSWQINSGATHSASGAYSDANGISVGSGMYQGVYGDNTITVMDAAGNSSVTHFTLDNVAPTITVKNTSTGSISGNVFSNANFKLYDEYQINKWWVNGGSVHTQTPDQWSDADNIAVGQNGGVAGLNTIHVTDQAGNEAAYDFYLNNVGPTITVKGKSNIYAPLSVGDFTDDIYKTVNFKLYDETKVDKFQVNSAAVVNLTDNAYSDANGISVGHNGGVEGANTIRVWDIAGNYTDFHFTLDTIAPTVTSTGYSTTAWTNGNVTVTLNFSEAIDPASLTGWTQVTSTQFTKLYTSNTSEHVTFSDLVGNAGSTDIAISNIDKTAPGVPSISAPAGLYWTTHSMTLGWDDESDAASPVSYNVVGSYSSELDSNGRLKNILTPAPLTSNTNSIDLSGFGDGTYYLQVQAVDAAGNTSAWGAVKEVIVDSQGPSATVSYSLTQPTNQPVTVTVTTSEPVNPIGGWNAVDGSNDTQFTKVYTANADETVDFTDLAGNPGSAQVTINNIDTTGPSVVIANPGTIGHQTSVTFTATIGDAAGYVVNIDGQPVDPSTVTEDSTNPSSKTLTIVWDTSAITNDTTHTITVNATDSLTNPGSDTQTFELDNAAPIVTINPSTGTDTTPTLTGTTNGANDVVTVDGVLATVAADQNIDGTYNWAIILPTQNTGTNTLTVKSTDSFGNATQETATVTVIAIAPLVSPTDTTTKTPVQSVTITPNNDNAGVLGDQTTTPSDSSTQNSVATNTDNNSDQAVKGATDTKNQATIFGLAWYWWLLILAVLAVIIWRIIAAYRTRQANQQ